MNDPGILETIGGTPLVELRRVAPPEHARVLVKVESHNPTGSLKDRMAVSVVDRAVATGRLAPGGTLVEYTGGSTGTSLAFVCSARGIGITLVSSDAFSQEKRDHMRALGAKVVEVPSDGGRISKELIQSMIARAAELCEAPGTFYADQFNNVDAMAGYAPLAEEIWQEAEGHVDAFVHSVGTAQSISGIARVLRGYKPDVKVVAVEPAESAVLSGGNAGAHQIEGIGAGFVPPLWDDSTADEVVSVSTADAKAMSRRLAREEALFAGTSSGANVVAALRQAEMLGSGRTVVTILCDSGLKYLSTDLYATPWSAPGRVREREQTGVGRDEADCSKRWRT
jgi:cysteine synthase A